jgi:hypothetical protein
MIKKTKLEELVLKTLSFYEPMTFSNIILDFDDESLKEFPTFDKEQLQQIIVKLEKMKLIKQVLIEKETGWVRIHTKRSWLNTIFRL